jgi:hypothetical protein
MYNQAGPHAPRNWSHETESETGHSRETVYTHKRRKSILEKKKKDKETRYYLRTKTGEFKKTRWTKYSVNHTKKELKMALKEKKKLEELLLQLEVQRGIDKKTLKAKEQERTNMQNQLDMFKAKDSQHHQHHHHHSPSHSQSHNNKTGVKGTKEVTVHDSSRPQVKGKKITIPEGMAFYELITLCEYVLGMQEGPSILYSESGKEIENLEQISQGDQIYLMPFDQ